MVHEFLQVNFMITFDFLLTIFDYLLLFFQIIVHEKTVYIT
ncbi:MAG: hypothetical protein RIQ33_2407 [Bacteroidota bacterium]|jgi:hypothetical protein